MAVRCWVERCGNKADDTTMMEDPRIHYYSLGAIRRKNPKRFGDFLRTIGYTGNLKQRHICSVHFADNAFKDFELFRVATDHPSSHGLHRSPRLKDDAWPTLNLPGHRASRVNLQCSVRLDRNQVQQYLLLVQDHSKLENEASSHQLAESVPNIVPAMKQEPQDACPSDDFVPFEHIEIDNIQSHILSELEGVEKMVDRSQLQYHIKLEPMEEIPPQNYYNTELVEDGIPSKQYHIKSEPMDDGSPSQHLDNAECVEDGILSQHLGNMECVEYITPSQYPECVEDSIPLQNLTDTEFLDVSTVFNAECDSKVVQNGNRTSSQTDPLLGNVQDKLFFGENKLTSKTYLKSDFVNKGKPMISVTTKVLATLDDKKPTILTSSLKAGNIKILINQNNVKEITQVIPQKSTMLLKKNNEPKNNVYMCLICLENKKKDAKMQTIDEFNKHLDTHMDTSYKQCSQCSQKCISINEYYSHVKTCHCDEIDFKSFVEKKQVNSNTEWWLNSCTLADCNAKLPTYCSKLLHEKYSTHVNCDNVNMRDNSVILAATMLKCLICNVTFKDENLYHAHCNSPIVFPESHNYCTLCKSYFESSQAFAEHAKKLHAKKLRAMTCKLCNTNPHSVEKLIRHRTSEHNAKAVYCFGCCKTIFVHNFKYWHISRCITNSTDPLLCALCSKMCQSLSELYAHLNVEELDLDHPQYQCRICHNYFCSKFNLCCHMLQSKCGK